MHRREFIAAALAAAAAPAIASPSSRADPARTRWEIGGSEGLDALCFLSPLSGDDFYARHYRAEVAAFAPRLPGAALDRIRQAKAAAAKRKALLSPALCLYFSAGPTDSLAGLLALIDAAETRLKPPLQASPYWDEAAWDAFNVSLPQLRSILVSLQEADFPGFRRDLLGQRLDDRIAALRTRLATLDVVAEQERLLGRRLDPTIRVTLLHFSKPHGIKVLGQHFLTHHDYPDEAVVRNAAHEMLHPPVDMTGPTARAALSVLERDSLLQRIVTEHNPAFGYNSLRGLFDEDLAQALEQIVSERVGVARSPRDRWKADDGMHVLAAGLYGLLKADGYDRTGGVIESWLADATANGRLAPASLHPAAAVVLERPASGLWPVPRE